MNWKLLASKMAPYLAATVALSASVAWYNHYQREIGRRDLLIRQYAEEATVQKKRADSLSLRYVRDTVRLWKTIRRTDTLTQTVEQWKHDTVKVVEFVQQADSTIKACTQALATCEQRIGAERARGNALQGEAALLRRQMPSAITPWKHRAEGVAVAGVIVALLSLLAR